MISIELCRVRTMTQDLAVLMFSITPSIRHWWAFFPSTHKEFFVLFSSAISDSAFHLAVTQNTMNLSSQDFVFLSVSPLDGFWG